MSDEGFNPEKSRIKEDTLNYFLHSPVSEDITSVPGIGIEAASKLALAEENDISIKSTFQLIGIFLTLREPEMSYDDHLDAFWYYLKLRGVNSCRSGIVLAISEKVNMIFPE